MKRKSYYDFLKDRSSVFDPNSMVIWDKRNIEIEILTLTGGETGEYTNTSGETIVGKIPAAEKELKSIDNQFKAFQQEKMNQGFEPPERWPRMLEEEKQRVEQRLELHRDELKVLQSWLKDAIRREFKRPEAQILEYGPVCTCSLHGTHDLPQLRGILKTIDNQKVAQTPEGILYIKDERSPYNSMYIVDYRRMSEEWANEQKRLRKERLRKLQEEARQEGRQGPASLPGAWGMTRVPKEKFPPWPDYARKYEPKVQEEAK